MKKENVIKKFNRPNLDCVEYLDLKMFEKKVRDFIDQNLIINPYFHPSDYDKSSNGEESYKYLFDFILDNIEESKEFAINILNSDYGDKTIRNMNAILGFIEDIDFCTYINNKWSFYFYFKQIKDNSLEFQFVNNCLAKFLKAIDFKYEITFSNDEVFKDILDYINELIISIKKNQFKCVKEYNLLNMLAKFYYFVSVNKPNKKNKINLYCDFLDEKLYIFLDESLKYYINSFNSNCDISFIECISSMLHSIFRAKEDFKNLDEPIKKRILKFYYLMIFYGNVLGIEIDWSDCIAGVGNFAIYNPITGFFKNQNKIKKIIINELDNFSLLTEYNNSYFSNENNEIKEILNKTIFNTTLLESAFYLKSLFDYFPIFSDMEYTPLFVNLFKCVEILACDLFKLLEIDKMEELNGDKTNKLVWDNKKEVICSFNNEQWEEKITLGGIIEIIKRLSKWKNKIYLKGKNITKIRNVYDLYKFNYSKDLSHKIDSFNEKYFEKKKIIKFHHNIKSNSDVLIENLQNWKDNCRNGLLHKNNVFDENLSNYYFEFTMYVINLLLEWYIIIRKSLN